MYLAGPLRERKGKAPHPLAITVSFVEEGVKKLRAMGAKSGTSITRCGVT